MKKLLFFATILFFFSNERAQEMNFNETISYIKEKLVNASSANNFLYPMGDGNLKFTTVENISFTKNGDVKIKLLETFWVKDTNLEFNLFKISTEKEGLRQTESRISITDNGIKGTQMGIFQTSSVIDAQRLLKAFLYLRSLCTKEKDPFDD